MCFVYVSENGAMVGVTGGHLTITHNDDSVEKIPKNTVDGLSIFGKSSMTAAAIQFCLENGVPVSFLTQAGRYIGRLSSAYNVNIHRQRRQFEIDEKDEFALEIARKIVHAKINNQMVVAKRYLYNMDYSLNDMMIQLHSSRKKALFAQDRHELMGLEGIASREYFSIIKKVIVTDYEFSGRNRRPAIDPFNSMLGFGYSLLTKEIYAEIENRGLNAYVGLLHLDKSGHPALASDMIEEWRATIVDSVVLSLIQGHEVGIDEFDVVEGKCVMSDTSRKKLLIKLEKRMHTPMQYLKYIDKPVTFRQAIWHQAERMAVAIEKHMPEYYEPVCIR